MKITFIDPTHSCTNYGLRTIAKYVNTNGHDVKLIFLNQPYIDYDYRYSEKMYEQIVDLIRDSDLIGFSVISNYFGQAASLTKRIKESSEIPVLWGGIHAMAAPEQCLQYADMICLGEGEISTLKLINAFDNGDDIRKISNIWLKEGDSIIRNEILEINPEIDTYSLPLYDNTLEYVRNEETIVKLSDEQRKRITGVPTVYYNIAKDFTYPYLTLASRGCPNSCTYCCNNLFKSLYKGKGKLLRRRSNANLISELETALDKMPFINVIEFFDDDFIFTNEETIAEFSTLYKKHINLPFRCNFRPESVTDEKIKLLVEAGLISIEMGLQSASAKSNKLYKRPFNKNNFKKAATIISGYKNIIPHYDLIVDNPFESPEDKRDTFRFLSELPGEFKIPAFSLTFFPGTELYRYAIEHNMIADEKKEILNKKNFRLYEYNDPFIKFLIFYLRTIGLNSRFKKYLFDLITGEKLFIILGHSLLKGFWIIVLFLKRFSSKFKHRGQKISLIPK